MMDKKKEGFTIVCNKCGNEIKLKNLGYYRYRSKVSILQGPVPDDGVDIVCNQCKQEIIINFFDIG